MEVYAKTETLSQAKWIDSNKGQNSDYKDKLIDVLELESAVSHFWESDVIKELDLAVNRFKGLPKDENSNSNSSGLREIFSNELASNKNKTELYTYAYWLFNEDDFNVEISRDLVRKYPNNTRFLNWLSNLLSKSVDIRELEESWGYEKELSIKRNGSIHQANACQVCLKLYGLYKPNQRQEKQKVIDYLKKTSQDPNFPDYGGLESIPVLIGAHESFITMESEIKSELEANQKKWEKSSYTILGLFSAVFSFIVSAITFIGKDSSKNPEVLAVFGLILVLFVGYLSLFLEPKISIKSPIFIFLTVHTLILIGFFFKDFLWHLFF